MLANYSSNGLLSWAIFTAKNKKENRHFHGVETPVPFPYRRGPFPSPSHPLPIPVPSQCSILWNRVQGMGMVSPRARDSPIKNWLKTFFSFVVLYFTHQTSQTRIKNVVQSVLNRTRLRDRSLFRGSGWPEILRGGHFFWQVADGGALIFCAKIFEKARETHFSARFWQK